MTIHWHTLSDKDKVRLIIEQVLHFSILPADEQPSSYPVASWDEQDGCWQLNDGEDTINFDPLHSLDDAWQIVEEVHADNFTLERIVTPPVEQQVAYARYSEKPLFYEAAFYLKAKPYHEQSDTPNEAICIAALRAVGVEVVTEEPLQR